MLSKLLFFVCLCFISCSKPVAKNAGWPDEYLAMRAAAARLYVDANENKSGEIEGKKIKEVCKNSDLNNVGVGYASNGSGVDLVAIWIKKPNENEIWIVTVYGNLSQDWKIEKLDAISSLGLSSYYIVNFDDETDDYRRGQ